MSFLSRLTCFAKLQKNAKFYNAHETDERQWSDDLSQCNLVSSVWEWEEDQTMHMPALDIDYPAHLLPSSTPGHFHLYLDKPLSWHDYFDLLEVMARVGLIEWGFYNAAKVRGATFLRLPNIAKQPAQSPVQPRRMRVPRPPGKEQQS